MKVYHYTSVEDWPKIQRGGLGANHQPGLRATRRVGTIHRDAFNTGALFALLEPTPKNWTHNDTFPDIWSRLKENIGQMLLEIEVEDSDENVFVIDRGEMEKNLYEDDTGRTERINTLKRKLAEGKYIGSKILFSEYLQHPEKYPFVLPEVIFTEFVPLSRITISKEQPLLGEYLDAWPEGGIYQKRDIAELQTIPELKFWYETKYLPGKKKESPASELGKLR